MVDFLVRHRMVSSQLTFIGVEAMNQFQPVSFCLTFLWIICSLILWMCLRNPRNNLGWLNPQQNTGIDTPSINSGFLLPSTVSIYDLYMISIYMISIYDLYIYNIYRSMISIYDIYIYHIYIYIYVCICALTFGKLKLVDSACHDMMNPIWDDDPDVNDDSELFRWPKNKKNCCSKLELRKFMCLNIS